MGRPGGNPDFGTKYRFDNGREKPLSEQVKAQVSPQVKEQLKVLAEQQKCTVPDLIREAIEQYLANKQIQNAS
jgi:Ribbon-helix-helix protein, copG family